MESIASTPRSDTTVLSIDNLFSSTSPFSSTSSSTMSSSHSSKLQPPVQDLINSLTTNRIMTLTALVRIERIAATCPSALDALSFQKPMTTAWSNYVTSNQLLVELHGLTPNYPFSGDAITDAHLRVLTDPDSNRSWNLAWLCLVKVRDDGLIPLYTAVESVKPEMWGDKVPTQSEMEQLATCFEVEWTRAVVTMLRHWPTPPTWY